MPNSNLPRLKVYELSIFWFFSEDKHSKTKSLIRQIKLSYTNFSGVLKVKHIKFTATRKHLNIEKELPVSG